MKGKKRRRSAKQRRATARMLAASRRRRNPRRKVRAMAKRRKHHHRKSHVKKHHRRRRSGGVGGGGRGIGAVKADAPRLVMSLAYGKVEALAAADANFLLNKVPRPIAALGYTGNVAAMLYLATLFSPNKYLRMGASVVATIATYKLGKQGKLYDSAETTTIGADYGGSMMEGGGDERVIDDHVMGALDAEATEFAEPGRNGLQYDDVVQEAGTRV